MSNVVVVGITGKARSGKDTVARSLIELANDKYGKDIVACGYSLASPMKNMLQDVLMVLLFRAGVKPPAALTDIKERIHGDRKEEVVPGLEVSARRMLQSLGTDWGRNLVDEGLWVKMAEAQVIALGDIAHDTESGRALLVIPDIRFDNETALCDLVIEVYRPEISEVAPHASEDGIADELIQLELDNDGTLEDLAASVEELFKEHVVPLLEEGKDVQE